MRFRSLVISWCFCAIYGSVQTLSAALRHRSLDETSSRRSTRHPLDDVKIPRDVLLERSRRNIAGSSTPSFPVSLLRTDDREKKTVDRFVSKPGSRNRKQRKKCSRRKQDARRGITPKRVKFADKIAEKSKKSSIKSSLGIVKNPLATSVDVIASVPTSTLNPTLELTTESSTIQQYFVDIAVTTTDVVPSTTKVIDDTTRGNYYEENPLRKKCRRTKCTTGDCKGEKKRNVIDILGDEFFPPDLGKLSASKTSRSSSSEDVDL